MSDSMHRHGAILLCRSNSQRYSYAAYPVPDDIAAPNVADGLGYKKNEEYNRFEQAVLN